jgi:hypothetical protein
VQPWLAGALAFISLALPVGWAWLNKNPSFDDIKQRWLGHAAVFFYFVGLPYLALITGLLPAHLLGLKGLEHFLVLTATDLGQAAMLWLGECLVDVGPMLGAGLVALAIGGGVTWGLSRAGVGLATAPVSAGQSLYQTIHWAFYWAIFWLITGDLYLGVVLGSAWVILEEGLIARLQTGPLLAISPLSLKLLVLLLTSAIFFYRPNVWLLWPIHLALTKTVSKYLG